MIASRECENTIRPFVHRDFTYDYYNKQLIKDGKTIPLSLLERTVLEILTIYEGKLVTYSTLNRVLRKYDPGIEDQSYDGLIGHYIFRVRKKIANSQESKSSIVTMRRQGYKMVI
jgi:DNA-binding response OmpR family regulator